MDETAGAIRDARASVSLHEQVVEAAPTFVDALYSLAVYNYVAGTFPWYAKLVSYFAGVRGDADEGRRLLKRVAEAGTTLRDAAQVTLAVIHLREDEPRRSAELLAQLAERYPRNYLFAQNRAFALGRACEWDTAVDLYAPLLGKVETNTPNYHLADPLVLALNWGHAAIQAARAPTARSVYSRLLSGDDLPAWARALAYLGRGQAHDLIGERDAALADYRSVLEEPDVEDSHDRAEEYLDDRHRAPARRPC
jgi:tetratricopeptide (TPR) repeat protein